MNFPRHNFTPGSHFPSFPPKECESEWEPSWGVQLDQFQPSALFPVCGLPAQRANHHQLPRYSECGQHLALPRRHCQLPLVAGTVIIIIYLQSTVMLLSISGFMVVMKLAHPLNFRPLSTLLLKIMS